MKLKKKIAIIICMLMVFATISSNPMPILAAYEDVGANYLTFSSDTAGSTISFSWIQGTVEYSTRKADGEWSDFSEYSKGTVITLTDKGDQVRFKGYKVITDTNDHFEMTGRIMAGGSVTSLTDGNGADSDVILAENCYRWMFSECTSLIQAPELPAVNLTAYCYSYMFSGCSGLINAPELPATDLAPHCYSYMFENCTNLLKAPKLPALNLAEYCYISMFKGCTGLTKTPKLPATELKYFCYCMMFSDCTGLTHVPELPATELVLWCYWDMFNGCKNLSIRTTPDEKHTSEWKISSENGDGVDWGKDMFTDCDVEGMENGVPHLNTTYYVAEILPEGEFARNDGCVFEVKDGEVICYDEETGEKVTNKFKCDGTYTYYFQLDGTAMTNRLTYHPDGEHVIYFDENGHEVFSDFAHITRTISGETVDDLCFFDVYGHMYVDTLTYDKTGTKLYYINPYGLMENKGWFAFSGHEFEAGLGFEGKSGGYGYANEDGSLLTNTYTYDWDGNYVYIQGDGHMFR